MVGQFYDYFPVGAQIVQTAENRLNLTYVAATALNGLSVHLVNTSKQSQFIMLYGLQTGFYHQLRSSSTENSIAVGTLTVDKDSLTTLPAP